MLFRSAFQEYFVKLRQEPEVLEADFSAAAASPPAPGVLESLREAQGIILAPSNPVLSLGPILAVQGVREALQATAAPVAAISPIVGGKALKGPADRNLKSLGMEASAIAVAELYRDFLDIFVMDSQDVSQGKEVEQQGLRAVVVNTVMSSPGIAQELARTVLAALQTSR